MMQARVKQEGESSYSRGRGRQRKKSTKEQLTIWSASNVAEAPREPVW